LSHNGQRTAATSNGRSAQFILLKPDKPFLLIFSFLVISRAGIRILFLKVWWPLNEYFGIFKIILFQKFEESRAATGKATALLSSETYSSRYIKEQNEDHEESSDEEYEEDFKEFATKLLYGFYFDFLNFFGSCPFIPIRL